MSSNLLSELWTHARERGTRPAVLTPDGSILTFNELWLRIEGLAGGLTSTGIRQHDVVAAVVSDGTEMLCTFLGVLRVAAFAPLNPALREQEFESTLESLGPSLILTDEPPDSAVRIAAQRIGIPVLSAPLQPAEPAYGLIGSVSSNTALEAVPDFFASPEARALLLHTSATTGTAKLIAHTHGSLRRMAADSTAALQLTESDRLLNMMPLFHLQGLLSCLEQLMAGGSVVTTNGFDAQRFADWMEIFRPSWYTAGPALHSSVLSVACNIGKRPPFPGLRFVRSIGAALSCALFQEIEEKLCVPVIEGYGLTEIGPVTSNPLPPGRRKAGSAGHSVGPEVAIWDESCRPLGPGEAGEIVVRCPAEMDNWLHTGDLGFLDGESYLYVSGRIKDVINSGGMKILPAQIDEVLVKHPAVEDAAAFGIWHAKLGEQVAAAVVLKDGEQLSESELRRFVFESLARFKVPRRVLFVDEIPKSATGKPQRQLMTQQWQHQYVSANGHRMARTAIEEELTGIWKMVLRLPAVSIDDELPALGGDSLNELELLTAVEERYGAIPDVEEFLLEPSVATMARLLGNDMPEGGRSAVVTLQPEGRERPFFCIPGAHEGPYSLSMLANSLGNTRPFHVLRDPVPAAQRSDDSIEDSAARILGRLRSLQPTGPYLLSGHCYGGIVAFELALQLTESGEEVDLLALIDTPTPGYPKPLRHWRRYASEALQLPFRRQVQWIEIREHLAFLTKMWRGKPISEPGSAFGASTMAINDAAGRRYRPRPYAGRISVFLAADEHHEHRVLDDTRLGWRDVARGGFAEYRVAGTHETILRPPHVRELAEAIGREMKEAALAR